MERIVDSKKVDNYLKRIANYLLLNSSFTENIGLLNGKMGIAIFIFNYARYSGQKIFENYGEELLEEIFEEISKFTSVDFANGLTGIGWGIEYLVKNNFIEGDTNEILREIDILVNQHRLQNPLLIKDGNDLFGFGLYFISRLQSHEDNDDIDTLMKKHSLIFLTDECEQLLIHRRYLDFNILSLNISTINSIFWFLIEMQKLDLFPSKTNKLLLCLPDYLSFSPNKNEELADQFVFYLLCQKFFESFTNRKLIKRYQLVQKDMNPVLNTIKDDLSFSSNYSSIVLQDFVYQLNAHKQILNNETFERYYRIIDDKTGWDNRLNNINKFTIGLVGFAGVGLCLLKELYGDHF